MDRGNSTKLGNIMVVEFQSEDMSGIPQQIRPHSSFITQFWYIKLSGIQPITVEERRTAESTCGKAAMKAED